MKSSFLQRALFDRGRDFIGGSVEVFWSHTSTRGLMSSRTRGRKFLRAVPTLKLQRREATQDFGLS